MTSHAKRWYNHPFAAKEQVLITLRLLASGSFLEVVSDTFLSYDKSTVSRVVRQVTLDRSSKVNEFIKFPSTRTSDMKSSEACSKSEALPEQLVVKMVRK